MIILNPFYYQVITIIGIEVFEHQYLDFVCVKLNKYE